MYTEDVQEDEMPNGQRRHFWELRNEHMLLQNELQSKRLEAYYLEEDILRFIARPLSSKATLVRKNGTKITVQVWKRELANVGSRGGGAVAYTFVQMINGDNNWRRDVIVRDGDRIEWSDPIPNPETSDKETT